MKVITVVFFMAFITCGFVASAQRSSTPAFFTVDEYTGCSPFKVTISAPLCSPCAILHDINDPSSKGKSINGTDGIADTLIYSKTGIYTMVIVSGTLTYTLQIIVKPNFSPSFELYACNANKVYLNVTDTHFPNKIGGKYFAEYPTNQTTLPFDAGDINVLSGLPAGNGQAVKVRARYNDGADNCLVNTQTVDVQNVINVPTFTQLTAVSASEIKLDFANQSSVLRKLEIAINNASNFQQLQNVVNTNTVNLTSNIRPDDYYYCFRLAAIDKCTNVMGSYSPVICSINFDAVAKNNQNDLSWLTSSTNIIDYKLTRNNATLPPNPSASDVSRVDNTAICSIDYTYQLTSNYSGATSVSLPKTVKAFSKDIPVVVDDITAVVHSNGKGVDLTWSIGTQPKVYSIIRTPADVISATLKPLFTDDDYTNQSNYCYRIKYINTCNNSSAESIEACPIHLSGSLQKDNSVVLSWTAYTGWKNGVANYTVEKYTTTGQLIQSFSVGTATAFTDDVQDPNTQSYVYVINAHANDPGLSTSVSNSISIIKQPNLFYPTAFTPNGNGMNDKFNVFGQYISSFEMDIFNRWGELMFTTKSLTEGWDGTNKGIPMPEGTYAFVAKITDSLGRTFKQSGSIVLLRKK